MVVSITQRRDVKRQADSAVLLNAAHEFSFESVNETSVPRRTIPRQNRVLRMLRQVRKEAS